MPRFLDAFSGQFVWVADARSVYYAILSHTWQLEEDGGEQTYGDVCRLQKLMGEPQRPLGDLGPAPPSANDNPATPSTVLSHPELSPKIKGMCQVAREAGYRLVWIDSCCIDKTSSAELSESINSMFEWYKEADVCYVYLADVPDDEDPRDSESDFRDSRWHKRGWTLQELIAPERVVFLSCTWRFIGTRTGLASTLEQITKIDFAILTGRAQLSSASVAKRMSWAAARQTTRVEDRAYSLLGIFDVHMSPIYGEGTNAFLRLQEEIIKTIPDQSIFAWGRTCTLLSLDKAQFSVAGASGPGLLAPSPAHFEGAGDVTPLAPADFALRLSRPSWFELPPLHCVFTPQGVQVRLLGTLLYRHDRIAQAILDAEGVDECYACMRLARVGACTLALLRCQDSEESLIALALYSPDANMERQENLRTATREWCGDWLHAPYRIVRISRDALAQVGTLLSPTPIEVYLLRYQRVFTSTKKHRAGFAKERGVNLWRDESYPGAVLRFAPGCMEELEAVGFAATPLEYQTSRREIVLSTSLRRCGSRDRPGSGDGERVHLRTILHPLSMETPTVVVDYWVSVRFPATQEGRYDLTASSMFEPETTSTRIIAEVQLDIPADSTEREVDSQNFRILRLWLQRPIASSAVADSSTLLFGIEVSEPYKGDKPVGTAPSSSRSESHAWEVGGVVDHLQAGQSISPSGRHGGESDFDPSDDAEISPAMIYQAEEIATAKPRGM